MKIGYTRVSAADQYLDFQFNNGDRIWVIVASTAFLSATSKQLLSELEVSPVKRHCFPCISTASQQIAAHSGGILTYSLYFIILSF